MENIHTIRTHITHRHTNIQTHTTTHNNLRAHPTHTTKYQHKTHNIAQTHTICNIQQNTATHNTQQHTNTQNTPHPTQMQERMMFMFSTMLGTTLFFILFECLYRISIYNLEEAESAFVLSYAGAYLISIVWQHGLNRYFVFPSAPYCQSLFHTYLIYSASFAIMTICGTFLITHFHIPPRLVTLGTLPISGVFNYYFLRFCLEESSHSHGRGAS